MQSEIILLKQLYIFRYLTQKQFCTILGLSGNAHISRSLQSLESKGLVVNYKSKSIIEPTVYGLSGSAAKVIKLNASELGIDLPLARSVTNLRLTSSAFKQHCMEVADIFCQLRSSAKDEGKSFSWLSKTQLYGFEPLPKPAPDALMMLGEKNTKQYFFIEVLQEGMLRKPLYIRLRQYYDFWKGGDWEADIESDCPKLMIITQSERQVWQVKKLLEVIDEDFAKECIMQTIIEGEYLQD